MCMCFLLLSWLHLYLWGKPWRDNLQAVAEANSAFARYQLPPRICCAVAVLQYISSSQDAAVKPLRLLPNLLLVLGIIPLERVVGCLLQLQTYNG
jgi:hypothetical protein